MKIIGRAVSFFLVFLLPFTASATKIQPVISPGGIKAWLVQEPTIPL